jgi:hypothetical protein
MLVEGRVRLYGSTTASKTFGEETTEYVNRMQSGYSSRRVFHRRVPRPQPSE